MQTDPCAASPADVRLALDVLARSRARRFKPTPRMSSADWIEANIRLGEGEAEQGRYRFARTPYLRPIADAVDDLRVRKIIVVKPSQTGYTQFINSLFARWMASDPSRILHVQPTVDLAKAWSRERFDLTIENCPPLKAMLGKKSGRRERDQTLRFIKFPGGYLASSGANSPGELSSRPARRVVGDEIGRWPLSAGEEGDPWGLLEARVTTFWNSLMIAGSTPGEEDTCRTTALYRTTDMGRWHVGCLHCDHTFPLAWRDEAGEYRLRWERDDDGKPIPGTTFYGCPECGGEHTERDKPEMLTRGYLHQEHPEIVEARGFKIDGLLSPWFTWDQMALKFYEAKGAQDTLKTFINTRVGEAFAPPSERINADGLMARAEPMPDLPPWVGAFTVGVDLQQDRFELLPVGFGAGERSAILPPERIWGRIDAPETVTEAVEAILSTRSGMIPAAVCVDTGYRPEIAWAIVDRLRARKVYAYGIKGMDELGRPIISEPSSKGRKNVRNPYLIGTNTVKDSIEARFRADPDGPKGVNFSDGVDAESFAQLTAEEKRVAMVNGRPRKVWKLRPGMRNEMLDMLGYAIGALHARGARFIASLGSLADERAKAPPPPPEPAAPHDPYNPVVVAPPRRRGGFVNSWSR